MINELTILAAGYWLAESRTKGERWRLDWENAAGLGRDTFDLVWQLLLLAGLGWGIQAVGVHLPQAVFVGLGLTVVSAYGLSLFRRRLEGARGPYFLALAVLALAIQQQSLAGSGKIEALEILLRLAGGSAACEVILLGLKERLSGTPALKAVCGPTLALVCLAMLAIILWSMGF